MIILFSAPNEVKLIVHVLDENDNAPKFRNNGRPFVAAIPNTVPYGFVVARIRVSASHYSKILLEMISNLRIRQKKLTEVLEESLFKIILAEIEKSTAQEVRQKRNILKHRTGR